MKKTQIVLVAMIALSIAVILLISPSKAISHEQSTITTTMPDNVKEILKNSCAGCHGSTGKEFTRAVWDLSEWENYSVKKQAKKAKAICKVITKGSMPPSSVKTAYPDKVPTVAQTEIICNWAKSLPKK
jgi:hypothetical protein